MALPASTASSAICCALQSSAVFNFTGKFYGNVTIRQALSNSLNIGAVKALAIVGIDRYFVGHLFVNYSLRGCIMPSFYYFTLGILSGLY